MALKSFQVPSLDWLDGQFRIERRKALIWSVLFLVIGIIIGGVLGYFDVFDAVGCKIEGFLQNLA